MNYAGRAACSGVLLKPWDGRVVYMVPIGGMARMITAMGTSRRGYLKAGAGLLYG